MTRPAFYQYHRIRHLFLAASPSGQQRIAYDWELRAIESSFAPYGHENLIHSYPVLAVQPQDLQSHLLHIQPHIVHFSGHGVRDSGLCVEQAQGEGGETIPVMVWSELFRILGEKVRLVVLNACYSANIAKAVAQYVDCTVGMKGEIENRAAVSFSFAFYEAIAHGRSLKDAYELGRTALMMSRFGDEQMPELFSKTGIDPARVFLIDPQDAQPVQPTRPIKKGVSRSKPNHSSQLRYTEGKIIFVGREAELAALEQVFISRPSGTKQICAIQGMAGVGKTWLVEHFLSHHKDIFPGRIKRLAMNSKDPKDVGDFMQDLADWLHVSPPSQAEPLRRVVVDTLRAQKSALHIENVDTEQLAQTASALAGDLSGVPIVVTGRYMGLGIDRHSGWTRVVLKPFAESDALQQLQNELGGTLDKIGGKNEARRLLDNLGYLPLAIRLAAARLRRCGMNSSLSRFYSHVWENLSLKYQDHAMLAHVDRDRIDICKSFERSLHDFRVQMGETAAQWEEALALLAAGPSCGFGSCLGMAVIGALDERAYEDFLYQALMYSLVEEVPMGDGRGGIYRIHPLLRRWLERPGAETLANERIANWIRQRIGTDPLETRETRWRELDEEAVGVKDWVRRKASVEAIIEFLDVGLDYILQSGSVEPWLDGGERVRVLSGKMHAKIYGFMGQLLSAKPGVKPS